MLIPANISSGARSFWYGRSLSDYRSLNHHHYHINIYQIQLDTDTLMVVMHNSATKLEYVASQFFRFITYLSPVLPPQQTRHIEPLLVQCWSTVYDACPTLSQQWLNVSCSLGPLVRIPPPPIRSCYINPLPLVKEPPWVLWHHGVTRCRSLRNHETSAECTINISKTLHNAEFNVMCEVRDAQNKVKNLILALSPKNPPSVCSVWGNFQNLAQTLYHRVVRNW